MSVATRSINSPALQASLEPLAERSARGGDRRAATRCLRRCGFRQCGDGPWPGA